MIHDKFKKMPLFSAGVEIVLKLKKSGFISYFVGGAVRDMLMDIYPKEIDIVTDADVEIVEKLFTRTVSVGKQFGVVKVLIGDNAFEVATCRKDGKYIDGRHPENVSKGSFEDDVTRRDFTINSLLYNPILDEIIDYKSAQDDIRVGIIRGIGDPLERINEDHLRMMRAIRFSSRFNFRIDESLFLAIKDNSHLINRISAERIRDELLKMLTANNNGNALELLNESGLLNKILPEVTMMIGVEQPKEFHPEGDVFTHTRLMFDYSQNPSPELAMGILLHDIGKVDTFEIKDRIRFNNHWIVSERKARGILARLKFSNDSIKTILELIVHHMRFRNVKEMREAKLKRFILMENFDLHLELHRLDCLASHGNLDNYNFVAEKLKVIGNAEKKILQKPIVTGDDLISMGLTPGPLFKEVIEFVKDSELEGRIRSKEEAVELIKEHFKL